MVKTRLVLLVAILFTAFSSCKKDAFDAEEQAKADDALIVEFIAKNNIPAVKHSSGIYFYTTTPSATPSATLTNTVTVNYEGKLLSGTTFDKSSAAVSFPLSNLIRGWQIGIPLVQKSGRIRLIIPSALAYGNVSQGSIPANSVLDFTIDLLNVQ